MDEDKDEFGLLCTNGKIRNWTQGFAYKIW
jgi:hypothetical protein